MALVMLDLDDTLVQRPPLVRAWFEQQVGDGDPALVDALVDADAGGHRPRPEFAELASERLGSAFSLEEFRAGTDGAYRLTPGVRSGLTRLRAQGWTLAVVTNGPVATQAVKVDVTGLRELVDAVCISEEVGVHKPDPLVFRTAAERAGATFDGGWMVGDNLDADIAGGRGVGVSTIWVRPPHGYLEFAWDGEPDVVVDTVDAALEHLIGLGR